MAPSAALAPRRCNPHCCVECEFSGRGICGVARSGRRVSMRSDVNVAVAALEAGVRIEVACKPCPGGSPVVENLRVRYPRGKRFVDALCGWTSDRAGRDRWCRRRVRQRQVNACARDRGSRPASRTRLCRPARVPWCGSVAWTCGGRLTGYSGKNWPSSSGPDDVAQPCDARWRADCREGSCAQWSAAQGRRRACRTRSR